MPRFPFLALSALSLALLAAPVLAGEIHSAVEAGDRAKVVRLLAADPRCIGEADTTRDQNLPLHIAAVKNQVEIAKLLLEAGAKLEGGDVDDSTPLMVAANSGSTEMINFLLSRGASVNRRDRNGACPAYFAMTSNRLATLQQLLQAGADLHFRNQVGMTALHIAAGRGNPEMVAFLLEQGLDPNSQDAFGRSPLFTAILHPLRGTPAIIDLLLAAKADPCVTENTGGRDAFHAAVLSGNLTAVEAMLKTGADPNVPDLRGVTPLQLARRYGHLKIADLLASKVKGDPAAPPDPPLVDLSTPLQQGEASVWYLNHSGYAVKTSSRLLIFDYWNPAPSSDSPGLANGAINPEEIAGQKVLVFVSHGHNDHYSPAIFDWRAKVPNITYVLGFRPDKAPAHEEIGPRQERVIDGVKITTIKASDQGVGFLVQVDGVTIFHAGDHANSTRDLSGPFKPEIDFLAQKGIRPDVMILPVSGCNFGDQTAVRQGIEYALATLSPKVFLPMHAGGREAAYREVVEPRRGRFANVQMGIPQDRGDRFLFRNGVLALDGGLSPTALAGNGAGNGAIPPCAKR